MFHNVPRVFISATSRDLGSFRKAVGEVLPKLDALPVVQDHFAPDYRSVVELLREKIGICDAAICLVGPCYGREPHERATDQPRRSYTQLEYEIAVELGKPVFVFMASADCTLDNPADEPDELRGLQLEHIKRIAAADGIRMSFRSLSHLTDLVRVMRFDPRSLAEGVTKQMVVLMQAELLDGTGEGGRARRGGETWVREVVQPFHELLQEVLNCWGGRLQSETDSEYEVNFETADAAVNAALALHQGLHRPSWQSPAPGLRVGIHVGQIVRFGGADESRQLQVGRAMDVCRRLTDMATAGQTLLTGFAFAFAREYFRHVPTADGDGAGDLSWMSYGRYLLAGMDESQEVCEVGLTGQSPLAAPPDSAVARRADSLDESQTQGWRPASGQEIPRRQGWMIERKLGEGGFGEVWVARQKRNPEARVFKFCFDANRLSSFKREQTLFRLLDDALGDRPDIARLREWDLDKAPFFLVSEYIKGGNLRDWGETDGRLVALPLKERLRLVVEIADAVAAAHSVGVIHRDLKPSNIFMRQASDGRWHPILADFGIGAVLDRSQLEHRGITAAGFTQLLLEPGSSRTGTRMYQPPEANLARPATMQGDVFALGILLFQMIIGDFDQPLGHGWERRLKAAHARGWVGETQREGEAPREPHQERETLSEPRPQGESPFSSSDSHPSIATHLLDPADELALRLLTDDIGACVDGDPSARLASVAQLVERLQTMDKRAADALTLRRAERARQRMRTLRTALAASVVALIVVVGLGAFASTQWRRAELLKKAADDARKQAVQHQRVAEENAENAQKSAEAARQQSQLALGTLNAVIFEVQPGLKKVPGSSPVRSLLLNTALKHLEKLSGYYLQQSTVDRGTAAALNEVGDLILEFGTVPGGRGPQNSGVSNPGELRSAVESARRTYSRSMEIFRVLAETNPGDARARRDLSNSYERIGNAYVHIGETANAMRAYRTCLDLREALAKADPYDTQAQRDLSISYEKLGDIHLHLGETAQAMHAYQKCLDPRLALAQADPNDAQGQRDLGVSYNKLGNAHLRLGKPAEAMNFFQKGLEMCEILAQAHPNDPEAQRYLASSYERLGDALLRRGDSAEAMKAYQKCLELSEVLAQADPSVGWAQRELANSYERLGDAHLRNGETTSAMKDFQMGLKLRDALATSDPNDAQVKRDLSASYERLGDAHLRLGEKVKAIRAHEKGLELRKALAEADPNDAQAQRDLASSYERLGDAQLGLGNPSKGLQFFQKGLDLREVLAKAGPTDAQGRHDLANSYERLGDAHLRLGDGHLRLGEIPKALQAHQKSLELRETLAKVDPSDAQAQRNLANSYERLGDVHLRLEERASMMKAYEKSLELREALATGGLKDAHAQRDLASSYQRLGDAHLHVGEADRAVHFFQKGRELSEGLTRIDPKDVRARLILSISYEKLGDAYSHLGMTAKAMQAYEKSLELREMLAMVDPKDVQAKRDLSISYNSLAGLLATSWDVSIRDGQRAVKLSTKACELTEWGAPILFGTLAAAYAEAVQFDDAVKWQKKVLEHPEVFGTADLEHAKARLKMYETHKPYRQPRPEPAPGTGSEDKPPSP
jgi:tetratricopeptide (TPR) repeat protein/serine/threonine protein kinase